MSAKKRKSRNESYKRPANPRHFSPFIEVKPAAPKMTGKLPASEGEHRDCERDHDEQMGEAIVRLYRAVLVNELPDLT